MTKVTYEQAARFKSAIERFTKVMENVGFDPDQTYTGNQIAQIMRDKITGFFDREIASLDSSDEVLVMLFNEAKVSSIGGAWPTDFDAKKKEFDHDFWRDDQS